MIDQSELDYLKDSLTRLIGKEINSIDETVLLLSKSGISIRGICIQQLNLDDEQLQNLLSLKERKKLEKFAAQTRKRQFFAGRLLAKKCLQDIYSDNSAALSNLTISSDAHGKPHVCVSISKRDTPEFLSITHKDKYVIVACSSSRTIGIDLEKLTSHPGLERRILRSHRKTDIKRVFEILRGLDPVLDQSEAYSMIWSALEAGFKAYTKSNLKSPMDCRLIIDKDRLFVIHQAVKDNICKDVFFALAKGYILTLVI
jgi:4'-phosphopantetheinyl transferase EntD